MQDIKQEITAKAIMTYYKERKNDFSFETDILKTFQRRWAVLTAGQEGKFNSMLIAWGELGTLWELPVATVYVAHSRYTHEFMESSPFFTLSFFPDSMRKQIVKFGMISGRDNPDKASLAGVTPKLLKSGLTFEEAEATIICQKLYSNDFDIEKVPEKIRNSAYADVRELHTMYIGQVVEVLK